MLTRFPSRVDSLGLNVSGNYRPSPLNSNRKLATIHSALHSNDVNPLPWAVPCSRLFSLMHTLVHPLSISLPFFSVSRSLDVHCLMIFSPATSCKKCWHRVTGRQPVSETFLEMTQKYVNSGQFSDWKYTFIQTYVFVCIMLFLNLRKNMNVWDICGKFASIEGV